MKGELFYVFPKEDWNNVSMLYLSIEGESKCLL